MIYRTWTVKGQSDGTDIVGRMLTSQDDTNGPLQDEVRDTSRKERRVETGRFDGSRLDRKDISGKETKGLS